MEIPRITVAEAMKKMDSGEPVFFIDTRNEHAWGEAVDMIPGSKRIHYSVLERHLDELPRDGTIIAYCT